MRKIAAAFDHAGIDLHDVVIKTIKECGCEVIDVGTDSHTSTDFPDYAFAGAQKILDREADKGIFVCGSGVGMCIAANKIKGIYAATAHDYYTAHQAVEHDNINVLCLGSRVIGSETAHDIIKAFLNAEFNNKPNQIRRMDKVRQIEDNTFELKNNSIRLHEFGQSVWLDNIRRGLIKNGQLAKEIERGVIRGITSNPSIFCKAIKDSHDYDNALTSMALSCINEEEIFFQLMVEDIRDAADLFRDLYVKSGGNDGFVCLEINPYFAHDACKTIEQAKQIWKAVNRPNLMIKIPATDEILPVITNLTAAGINLNLTLIFSPEKYKKCAYAYIDGLRKRMENGDSLEKIRSVASVFVSRADTKTDTLLIEKGVSSQNLLGKTGIRTAQRIYNISIDIFGDDNFDDIKAAGGKAQRVLWASTSTKNPLYKPTYYVEALVGSDTVTTLTPVTLDSLMKSSNIRPVLPVLDSEIDEFFVSLEKTGINIQDVYLQLEDEGISGFTFDYSEALSSIKSHCKLIRNRIGKLNDLLVSAYERFNQESIMRRIFSKDPTVWTYDTTAFSEIRNRLGWLDTYKNTEGNIPDYISLRNKLKKEQISKIILLGTEESSLAAEVIAKIFDKESDIKLQVVDTTDPVQITEIRKSLDLKETIFIVCSKSGASIEINSLLRYFYEITSDYFGENAGKRFIAITDPGSRLETVAEDLGFRQLFLSDPSSGGRFSALTPFGIIPAILIGLDPQRITPKVREMMLNCSPSLPAYRNEGLSLGIFIGAAAEIGKDKLTIISDPSFEPFTIWIEQLIAQSSGKNGKGIIPVINEPQLQGRPYAEDRVFVYINSDNSHAAEISQIKKQGHPVYEILIDDQYDLFGEFYRWETAAAAACAILGVNPFDHPDALASKTLTNAKLAEYRENRSLSDMQAVWSDNNIEVFTNCPSENVFENESYNDIITNFIKQADAGKNYIAINAFLPQNEEMLIWLQKLRKTLLECTGCATTIGFGPRFLHTAGQLHKGGANLGYFIQVAADYNEDTAIPDEIYGFKILERAQALAEIECLRDRERKVIQIRFKNGLPA